MRTLVQLETQFRENIKIRVPNVEVMINLTNIGVCTTGYVGTIIKNTEDGTRVHVAVVNEWKTPTEADFKKFEDIAVEVLLKYGTK